MVATMLLVIESDHAQNLATELAGLTGESLYGAVTRSLEERLDRERRIKAKIRAVMDIVRAAGPADGVSSDHDDLYDERGLPL